MSTNRFGKELKEYNYTKEELAKFNYAKITTKNGEILIKLLIKRHQIQLQIL